MDPGIWLRTVRASRRISQRELADVSGRSRSMIERIEAGSTIPRLDTFVALLEATGYHLVVHDQRDRLLRIRPDSDACIDRGGRYFPAHLPNEPTGDPFAGSYWWGWSRIAWPFNDDWVPEKTYWRRRELPRFGPYGNDLHEHGRVWDDAT